MKLLRRATNRRIFDNIDDLSIFNYWKAIETGELTWLLKEGRRATEKQLAKAWENVRDQVIDLRFKDPEFKADFERRRKRAYLLARAYRRRDIAQITRFRIEDEKRLAEENQEAPEFNLLKSIFRLRRVSGVSLDEKTTSVRAYIEFMALLRLENVDGENRE